MKKTLIASFAFIFGLAVITFSSCKSHDHCPAYGLKLKAEAAKARNI